MGFKKGLYLLWPDFDYIDKCVKSGIDHLLIANQNTESKADEIHPHWGQYKESLCLMNILEEYYIKHKPDLEMIFLPIWVCFYMDLPKEQQFYDGEKYITRTPCPTSLDWINSRLEACKYMIDKSPHGMTKDIMFDPEHYAHSSMPDKLLDLWEDRNNPKHICKCPRCKEMKLDNIFQWVYHNNKVKEKLNELNLKALGQLQNENAWNYYKYHEHWYYTERTYPVRDVMQKWWKLKIEYPFGFIKDIALAKKNKIDMKISAGVWVERFKVDDLLDYIKWIGKNPIFDGYWFYPQNRFSKYSWIKQYNEQEKEKYGDLFTGLIDDPNVENSDPQFFEKLKKVHKYIDDYRDSWEFKLKKYILKGLISAAKLVV